MDNLPQQSSAQITDACRRFGIIGRSPALLNAVGRALRVAPIDLSVLVEGESGSGKEFFPKIIHAYGSRKHARYIAVNCGAIPEGTIDSELFGHEKGAFTGAVSSRKGYFEEADGGTIFLDEVAELPLTTQARLLRVLESGEFIKVGSSTVQRTDIRVVAATNVDMLKAVREGRFREDLYYRLSTVNISVPPLRDRGAADITMLISKFAADFAERYRTPILSLSSEAMESMQRYRWPGNVRQLKNVVEQMCLFESGHQVTPDILRHYLPDVLTGYTPAVTVSKDGDEGTGLHSYSRERDILFNMIFRMQRRIDTLTNEIERLRGVSPDIDSGTLPERRMIAAPSDLPAEVNFDEVSSRVTPAADITSVTSPSTLEDTERETIRRALERNGGRRKATATELQISERTLYRKIREYGLESL